MSASSARLRRLASPLLRALAAGLVLAGALSTLAGVSPKAPGFDERPPPRTSVLAPAVLQDAAGFAFALGGAGRHAMGGSQTATVPRAAPATEPPPFAPGGDDLLPSSEALATPYRATTVATPVYAPVSAPVAAPVSAPIALPAPAPQLWLERTTVALGGTAVLHLASAGAGSACRGAGALQGMAMAAHHLAWRVTTAGQHRLAVVCTGTGGPVAAEVLLTVPLPVALSSLANQQPLDPGYAGLPGWRELGLSAPPAAAPAPEHDLMVPGDYLQQGRLSLFVVAAGADGVVSAHVMARDGSGRWTDHTAKLLDDGHRGVCASALQAIGSDFNRDGRPDVWIACDGRQLLFLSQPDGRYRRIETPFALQALQAEARDVDGDGWPDIVTVDTSQGAPRTLLLLGRGDGRFEAGPAQAWGLALPFNAGSR